MKVLLHTYRCPAAERWQRFESVLEACLLELGHQVTKIEYAPTLPGETGAFDFRIYPHTSKHQILHGDLFFKEMFMHDLFTIDPDGWGPEHSGLQCPPDLSRIDPAAAEEFCGELRRGFLASGHSKHSQPPLRPIDAGFCPYLLAPLQVPTDDSVKFHSPVTVLDYVNLLSDWAERARMRVVFKLHPGREFPEIAQAVRRRVARGKYVTLLDENIHALIANAAGVVVQTSGVGFESLIHGKPVVTLGRADYRWVTFHTTPRCLDAALANVREYSKAQREAAAKFIYYYYHQHAYLMVGAAAAASKVRLLEYLKSVAGARARSMQQRLEPGSSCRLSYAKAPGFDF